MVAAESEENIRSIVDNSITLNSNTRDEVVEQVKINTRKIENIEMLVTKLSSRLGHLFGYDSCSEAKNDGILRSGIYKLLPGLEVYCDQTTDGGGWTVFHRRKNGEVDFYRNWKEYKNGFGDVNGEFWLGNEHLSILTATGDHELRIDMEDFEGNRAFAKYSKFKIYPEEDKYKLEVSGYSGNAGDSLEYHSGMAFSTFDNDNDKYQSRNCAKDGHGAWWYNICHYSHLNGQYFNILGKIDTRGITWWHWKESYYSLKSVEMKFR
ncbi:microfibril-associated glycoprotein 4-like [Mercenaria mercenaria]|uniref:microfibril-associated glycoprotein 4-like n=1 Tax=Mercenaria mercenaria TaxID=6596 RepID=UPI00234ECBEB|nr:microfibril-associated glycoprotein 4-like [Mercenaria mercenaria]